MEAANRGAALGQPDSQAENIGIRVNLPFEQSANPYVEGLFTHGTFFTRLHQFVMMSDAYVVVPGGIGTLLEAMMVWQLVQVRQLDTPLILVGPMWQGLIDWARSQMLRPGFELAGPGDFDIPICVGSTDEAMSIIRRHHQQWRSERQPAEAE
jgi:predicted Rossmann-fold nucleotide-binding protein